jgi:lipid A 3-O-deacylase
MNIDLLRLRHRAIRRCTLRVLLVATTLMAGANAVADGIPAPSGLSVTTAGGQQSNLYGAATFWDSICTCAILTEHGFDTRLYTMIAYWEGTQRPTDHPHLWEGSVTPTVRWLGPTIGPTALFAEAGIGMSLLSSVRLNETRHFATAFQFNEQIGVGFGFGPKHRYELIAYLRHVSNGSIKQPNDGDSFFGGAFRVPFD